MLERCDSLYGDSKTSMLCLLKFFKTFLVVIHQEKTSISNQIDECIFVKRLRELRTSKRALDHDPFGKKVGT